MHNTLYLVVKKDEHPLTDDEAYTALRDAGVDADYTQGRRKLTDEEVKDFFSDDRIWDVVTDWRDGLRDAAGDDDNDAAALEALVRGDDWGYVSYEGWLRPLSHFYDDAFREKTKYDSAEFDVYSYDFHY